MKDKEWFYLHLVFSTTGNYFSDFRHSVALGISSSYPRSNAAWCAIDSKLAEWIICEGFL